MMLKNLITRIFSVMWIFAVTIVIAALYAQEAQRLGLFPVAKNSIPSTEIMIFSCLAALPLLVIVLWPMLVRHELLSPPIRILGTNWRIVISKWRAAFLTAISSLLISNTVA